MLAVAIKLKIDPDGRNSIPNSASTKGGAEPSKTNSHRSEECRTRKTIRRGNQDKASWVVVLSAHWGQKYEGNQQQVVVSEQ